TRLFTIDPFLPFHEPVLFSGWNRRWHKLLAELSGETTESALFGLQHLSLVLGESMFDVVGALDHHAPEEDGELARQGDIGDQATASRVKSRACCKFVRGTRVALLKQSFVV